MKNATKVTISTFGVLAGVAGLEHGIGEILQGTIPPSGIVIESWPGSTFFRIVAGEPAMTIIPSLLVSGLLTILVSLIFITWAIMFVQKKHGGLVMILLSMVLLLVGGGFGPPILGVVLGAAATRIGAPLSWWRVHLSAGLRRFLEKSWGWSFIVCLVAWLVLFPGLNILSYFFGLDNPGFVLITMFFALATLLLTITTGIVHDIERQTGLHRVVSVSA